MIFEYSDNFIVFANIQVFRILSHYIAIDSDSAQEIVIFEKILLVKFLTKLEGDDDSPDEAVSLQSILINFIILGHSQSWVHVKCSFACESSKS